MIARWSIPIVLATLAALVVLGAVASETPDATDAVEEVTFSASERRRILRHSPLPPTPPDPGNRFSEDPRAARLGQRLFFDPRLSADGTVSCVTCHDPKKAFTDGREVAQGIGPGTRNTMGIWNASHQRWFFWDGRTDSLWSQALKPIESDVELDGNRLRTVHLIAGDDRLRAAYEDIFGRLPDFNDRTRFPADARPIPDAPEDPRHRAWIAMTDADRATVNGVFANVGKAIAAYERLLVSRRASFDVFVEGLREDDRVKMAALSPSAQRGLKLFIGEANCRLCHTGPLFSDGEFHSIGVPPRDGALPQDPGRYLGADLVRKDPFRASGAYSDEPDGAAARRTQSLASGPDTWGQFKTPSLRNVELTAPYMHEGQFATLEDVLHYYSTLEGAVQLDHHQEQILVPLNLDVGELADLLAFLESLTDVSLDPSLLAPLPDDG